MTDDREKLRRLAISEAGFVFDPSSGSTFDMNATGRAILRGLAEGLDGPGLRDLLERQFNVQNYDVDRDLAEFALVLRHHHLLPQGFSL